MNLTGQNFISAQEKELKGKDFRLVKVDGIPRVITCDYKSEKLNLEIENGIIVNVYEG